MESLGSYDVVVIGSGVSGLAAALTSCGSARVAIVTRGHLDDGCSRFAQGGMAAAIAPNDSPELHYSDTMDAGRGLCDPNAVRVLVESAPSLVEQLVAWGVAFDRDDRGAIAVGQEAAHSRRRILHAHGDATGLELETALVARVRASAIDVFEMCGVTAITTRDGRAVGVGGIRHNGESFSISGRSVILASGGAGCLWGNTTNPASATGDGVALAYLAGAEVASMEFVQFHPTALMLEGAPRFLVSEAVRGEGAHVVNEQGERFLFAADERGELAPRDTVSSAIWRQINGQEGSSVFLDCSPLADRVATRFPSIHAQLHEQGIDMERDLVPIAPAAHYLIGGVKTDLEGRTCVPGLFASGEVASTGVHGANRLASNSLLESMVFAQRAARAAVAQAADMPHAVVATDASDDTQNVMDSNGDSELLEEVAKAMWRGAGLVRTKEGINEASRRIASVVAEATSRRSPIAIAAMTANLVCQSAAMREESRGAHVREDFDTTSDLWSGLIVAQKERGIRFDHFV